MSRLGQVGCLRTQRRAGVFSPPPLRALTFPQEMPRCLKFRAHPHSLREDRWFRLRPGEIISDKSSHLQVSFKQKVRENNLTRSARKKRSS